MNWMLRQILANQMGIAKALYYILSGDFSSDTREDVMTGLALVQKASFEALQRIEVDKGDV